VVLLHRRIALGEGFREGRPVATALLPTLVFSLVIAELAAEGFDVPGHLVGGIVLYALGNTVVPALVLKGAPAFDAPSLDPDASGTAEAERPAAVAPPAP
jgi:hypothetical protein